MSLSQLEGDTRPLPIHVSFKQQDLSRDDESEQEAKKKTHKESQH